MRRSTGPDQGLPLSSKRLKAEFQQLIGPTEHLICPAERLFAAFRHGFELICLTIAAARLWLGRCGLFPAAPNDKPTHINSHAVAVLEEIADSSNNRPQMQNVINKKDELILMRFLALGSLLLVGGRLKPKPQRRMARLECSLEAIWVPGGGALRLRRCIQNRAYASNRQRMLNHGLNYRIGMIHRRHRRWFRPVNPGSFVNPVAKNPLPLGCVSPASRKDRKLCALAHGAV